jgi:hypothetical protein
VVVLQGRLASFWERLGREVYGPLYLGFAGWLARRIVADAPDRVFFLARDGHIIERLWRIVGGGPASYLYASRRALRIPAIEKLDERALDFLCGGNSRLTVAQYFERAGLRSDDREFVDGDRTRLREAFRAREKELLEVAARERELLLAYFRQEKLDGRVAIVDLGWHGTLQRAMRDVLRIGGSRAEPVEIEGWYLATFPQAAAHSQRMSAFLCELGAPAERLAVLRRCVELFELGFVAPHGGVDGFQRAGGRIEPRFAAHDLDEGDRARAFAIQSGGLAYVAENAQRVLDPDEALAPMRRLLERPSIEEARALGDLRHAEGFGAAIELHPIARPPAAAEVLRRPYALKDAFERSFWREGFKTRVLGTSPTVRRMATTAWRWGIRLAAAARRR